MGALFFVVACIAGGAAGGAALRRRTHREAPYWAGVCAALGLPDVDTEAVVLPFRARPVLFDQDQEPVA